MTIKNKNHVFQQLRNKFDGSGGFMESHQILQIRRPTRKKSDWQYNDETIKKMLLKSFPKLDTNDKQRKQAGRWARVIQLYFRSGKSYRETAHEMRESLGTIHTLIRSIVRASVGKTLDGRSRKKKNHAPEQTSIRR